MYTTYKTDGEDMSVFLFILTNNLLPVFILILVGFMFGRRFDLDRSTLTKINIYFYVPFFILVNIYTTDFQIHMLKALAVVIMLMITNKLIGSVAGKLCGYEKGKTNAFTNSLMFYNSGNFGLPLITLVFSSGHFLISGQTPYLEYAITIQVIVIVVQNLTTNTIGVFNANQASSGFKGALYKCLKMPALYFVLAAFLLKLIPYDLTQLPIWSAFTYIKNGLVSIALFTLGVQLSHAKLNFKNKSVYLSVFLRLVGGPVIALLLVLLFGIEGIMAQVLIISSAVPTAVNTALISSEFNNHPDFASQIVMVSTVFSAVTLTGVIYMASILFPV